MTDFTKPCGYKTSLKTEEAIGNVLALRNMHSNADTQVPPQQESSCDDQLGHG